ncbi:MAG: cytochrome P450 [Lasallia pustulata]|uniref:Cytochrome P450 n=1 Tax=Lasallia pustulata TaxID=136370 RepID=A0A5M8PVZ3_9LECA|nr:MAG: cytochrome P450 [Lasallia pustulata]
MDSIDANALASQDLGLIWAENANSIPAVFWFVVELLQRPHFLSQAREEVTAAQFSSMSGDRALTIESLCSNPLLQSVYAEILRIYTSLFALRSAAHEDFKLGEWSIYKDELIATVLEEEEPYPLSQFWAAKFLKYPDDPFQWGP